MVNNSGEIKKAIVAGHLCLDIIPGMQNISSENFFDLLQPGRLIEVEKASISTGGAASNTGLSLHILGIDTKIVAKIGKDYFGNIVKDILRTYGASIADELIVDEDCGTSYTVIINPPGIDRIFLHAPAANDSFSINDLDFNAIRKANLFHFGYPQLMKQMYIDGGEQLKNIFREVKSRDVITSLDVTFPDPSSPMGKANWKAILQKTLPYVDIFSPSIEEIIFMVFPDVYQELQLKGGVLNNLTGDLLGQVSDTLLLFGVKILMIKLGEKGLYLRTKENEGCAADFVHIVKDPEGWENKELWVPCFDVEVAGTTGAGDATIAGFLASILRGCGPEESLKMAAAVGACNVEKPDALSGVKRWEETKFRIEQDWPRKKVSPITAGWHFNKFEQLWVKT